MTTYLLDSFSRTVVDGFGTPDTGPAYTLSGTAADYDVGSGVGTASVPAANTQRRVDAAISVADAAGLLSFSLDRVPTGANDNVWIGLRKTASNTYYYAVCTITTAGAVTLGISKAVAGVFSSVTTAGPATGITYTAGMKLWLSLDVSGTTVSATVWRDGTARPAAQRSATDSDIAGAGSMWYGIGTGVGSTNLPRVATFDDVLVVDASTAIAATGETGSGADGSSETTAASVSQTGTGADASSEAVDLAPSQTGSGADAAALAATAGAEDAGAGAEVSSVHLGAVVPDASPDWVEAWVTTPAGVYLAHLERSRTSPFRAFGFSVPLNEPGVGSLEYAEPNAILEEVPTLFDEGNLVWMRYRSRTVAWIVEQTTQRLQGEQKPWVAVTGRTALQLLGDRLVWPDGFSEDDLDPSVWSGPGVLTTTTTHAADAGDRVLIVDDAERWREGQRVSITSGGNTDTSHIRRLHLRDDGEWAVTLRAELANDHASGSTVTRHGPAFVSTTLAAAASAGDRRLLVESAKRLHPGARLTLDDGAGTGEEVVVRDVEHVRAKAADSASVAVAASAGDRSVVISGKHFHAGETVTITEGATHESREVLETRKISDSPLRYRVKLASALTHSYTTAADVSRAAVPESWTITLRRPLVNGYPSGADVSRPSDQWHTVVATPAGEMLWDLIDATNARFGPQILRGTIESDPDDGDQWTQRFRFENLLDVARSVTDAFGDVDMDGLTISYAQDLGEDLSGTVVLEEGVDLLRVERDRDWREAVSWVVAEGVGEGSRAKLAVSSDEDATRRREAYLDAHDTTNLPQLEAAADGALAQNGVRDSVGLDLLEARWAAFDDFDLGDRVRAVVPSRGIDETVRIVALYVLEADERVRVSVDVNSQRTEWLLELERGKRQAARTLGIHGRQPQGQLVPFTFSGSGVLDEDEAMETFLHLPDRAFLIAEVTVRLQLRRFWATSRSAASGGGSTSGSGGGASGGGSTSGAGGAASGGGSTSGSGGGSTVTDDADHDHAMFQWMSDTPGGYATRKYLDGSGVFLDLATDGPDNTRTSNSTAGHSHGIPSHTHTTPDHSHGTHTHTTPDHSHGTHTHTTPDHSHDLVFGTYAEALPSGWKVDVLVDRLDGTTWTNVWTSDPIEDPDRFATLELSTVITEPGSWRIRVKSEAGQPQGGRMAADLWGVALAGLESA